MVARRAVPIAELKLAAMAWSQLGTATGLPCTITAPAQTLKGLDGTSYPAGSTVTLAPLASIVLLWP